MRKKLLGFTAAIFVVNGMQTSRIFGQADPLQPQQGSGNVDRPSGPSGPTGPAAGGAIADDGVRETNVVRDTLGRAASAALSEKFAGIGDFITDTDKQRLGEKLNDIDSRLMDQLGNLRGVWKEKYKQDFDLRANLAALNVPGMRIFPVSPNAAADGDQPLMADPADKSDKDFGNVVMASLPAAKNIPAVEVKLMRQELGSTWKIDLPDTMSASELRSNLADRLSVLLTDSQNWPTDPKDAYRLVAQHTLAALVAGPIRTSTAMHTP